MPLESIQIFSLLCCWIFLVCLQKNVSCCGSTMTLTVDEGEDVILPLGQSQAQLSFINWDFEKHIIATTSPGRKLELETYSNRYPGRLFSSNDGSLVITRLTSEDGRIYRAELYDVNWRFLCVQLYDVRTDGRGGIPPSVDPSEACSSTKQIILGLGEDVTLTLPSHSRVAFVQWDINNIDHIVITRPGGIVHRQSHSYRGKVSATGDGSLRLLSVTTTDQHVYRAELFTNQWTYICRQHYDVRVKKINEEWPTSHNLENHIRLVLSACILLATLSILIYHVKTENSRTPQ